MASLREQVEYEHWATLESMKAIRAADKLLAEAEAIVAHVVGIRELWAARVEGVAARFEAWPKLALEQSAMEVAGLRRRWLGLCDAHAAEARIDYRSSGSGAGMSGRGRRILFPRCGWGDFEPVR